MIISSHIFLIIVHRSFYRADWSIDKTYILGMVRVNIPAKVIHEFPQSRHIYSQ
jgi:hypothetical protein